MKLYHETHGDNGPDVVLLHGWGLHGGIWKPVAAELAQHYRVMIVDLPGHGRSRAPTDNATLQSIVASLAEIAPAQATWLGWSLGATIAMRAALDMPDRVARLILVAATPLFIARTDWPAGMNAVEFDMFADSLACDIRATLKRFLALQVRDSRDAPFTLRQLRARLADRPPPALKALQLGLEILRQTDLRSELDGIRCRALLIHGAKDSIVPINAARSLHASLPAATIATIPDAGHAPFLSDRERFLDIVHQFLHD